VGAKGPRRAPILLDVPRFEQPDEETCGPTCLAKVYQYYGASIPLEEIIAETPRIPGGGTLAVNLGISAIGRGFQPTIYPFGLRVFDPTWLRLDPSALIDKLMHRAAVVDNPTLRRAVEAYADFLKLGGQVRFENPTADLLVRILEQGDPILTGLSATFLYGTAREYENRYDDVRGHSAGHFVVVCGYEWRTRRFVVTDPFRNVPLSKTGRYTVPAQRLLLSILLGDQTYDAVLLTLGRRVASP
jgi:hypothetical protein